MALQKDFEDSSGNIGNYWKVTNLVWSITTNRVTFDLHVYKDHEARLTNKSPMQIFQMSPVFNAGLLSFAGKENPISRESLIDNEPMALIYNKLKTVSSAIIDFTTDTTDV